MLFLASRSRSLYGNEGGPTAPPNPLAGQSSRRAQALAAVGANGACGSAGAAIASKRAEQPSAALHEARPPPPRSPPPPASRHVAMLA
eukprot:2384567-Pleurochrysis_carterae.AAC.1